MDGIIVVIISMYAANALRGARTAYRRARSNPCEFTAHVCQAGVKLAFADTSAALLAALYLADKADRYDDRRAIHSASHAIRDAAVAQLRLRHIGHAAYSCGYCGCTEPPVEDYAGAWPSCPQCKGV